MRLIIPHAIDAKSEGFLLYAPQTAQRNLRHTDLESDPRECVVIDPSSVDEILLDEYRWEAEGLADEELQDQDDDDDDEEENEENDDEDEDEDDEDDEEEEPPMYVEGGTLHCAAVACCKLLSLGFQASGFQV